MARRRRNRASLDLDVDAPDKVADVLRTAADAYHASAAELASAWQYQAAGRPWTKIARIIERAADQIDQALEKLRALP